MCFEVISALVFIKPLSRINSPELCPISTILFHKFSHLTQIYSSYFFSCCSISSLLPFLPHPHDTQQVISNIYTTPPFQGGLSSPLLNCYCCRGFLLLYP